MTWRGVNEIGVEDVPEPTILNGHDIILEVGLSATCGSPFVAAASAGLPIDRSPSR